MGMGGDGCQGRQAGRERDRNHLLFVRPATALCRDADFLGSLGRCFSHCGYVLDVIDLIGE